MKAIEGMQPQINDMERRLGIMQSVEPVLENAIKTLQKVVDVRGMGKKSLIQLDDDAADAKKKAAAVKEDVKEDGEKKEKKEPVETEADPQAAVRGIKTEGWHEGKAIIKANDDRIEKEMADAKKRLEPVRLLDA